MNLQLGEILTHSIFCSIGNQVSVNRFYWQVSLVGGSPATYDDAASQLDLFYAPLYKAVLANTAYYNGTVVQRVWPLPVLVRSIDDGHGGFGTAGANACPKQSAPIISYYTAFAGPGGRGRTYLPFPSTTDITTLGEMTAGYKTNATVIAASRSAVFALSDAGRTAELTPGLWRRTGNVFTTIDLAFIRSKVATQKRRGDYGRANLSPV